MKRTQFEIGIIFKEDMTSVEVEKAITEALERVGLVVSNLRYTYVETQFGMADLPHELMLAFFMSEKGGFGWYLPKFTGGYLLKFGA